MANPVIYANPPSKCDVCGEEIVEQFYDAAMRTGQWACMCSMCFSRYGIGLGIGRGQKYEWNGNAYQKVKAS